MFRALKTAATGMNAQQMNVDVLSNNIANLNTTAYKRQRAAFQDLVYQSKIAVGATTSNTGTIAPTGAQIGLGVNIGSVYKVLEQGSLLATGKSLDLAIQGRGYFSITLPDGTLAYTRDGAFQKSSTGEFVTSKGYLLDPSITIPDNATEVTVATDGTVSARIDDTITDLGQITVSTFANEAGLKNLGENLLKETIASGTATQVTPGEEGSGTLLSSYLEASNVDPIEEVTNLITAQRAYELNSRVISAVDEMMSAANQIR